MKKIVIMLMFGSFVMGVSANAQTDPAQISALQQKIMRLQGSMTEQKSSKAGSQNIDQVLASLTPQQKSMLMGMTEQLPAELRAQLAAADATTAKQVKQEPAGQSDKIVDSVAAQNVQLPSGVIVPATVNTGDKTIITDSSMYDQAFSGLVNQLLPMNPDQIAKLRDVFSATQIAASTPAGVPPKPTTTSVQVSLSPQAAPPVIRLGAGYITSLVFMDSSGQPWPIAAYSIGDPTAFNIQWDKKGNTLLVQSLSLYKRSNLAVMLKDLNTPVMLTLMAGQGAIDYRVDLRVPGVGPNAVLVQDGGLPDAANAVLLEVLNGVPPAGSKELKVSGGECQGWILGDKLFLRTGLDVISPAWKSIMSSIDGTHAYELQPTPIILALHRGKDKVLTLAVEGLE